MAQVISIIITAFFSGALARFAVPGPDPMPAWLTILIGLIGSPPGGGPRPAGPRERPGVGGHRRVPRLDRPRPRVPPIRPAPRNLGPGRLPLPRARPGGAAVPRAPEPRRDRPRRGRQPVHDAGPADDRDRRT